MTQNQRRVLVVAATQNELEGLSVEGETSPNTLITGVGMVATAHHLTKAIVTTKPTLVLNIGIAGAFSDRLSVGDVVQVVNDQFAELGVEDGESFISADDAGLVCDADMRFGSTVKDAVLPAVSAITVNRVHGNDASIRKVTEQFTPDVESMEGAAVAYVCKRFDVPWMQVRAISNRVERRNREAWDIPLALKNLHREAERILKNH